MQSSNPLRYFVSEVHLRSPHQHAKFYQHIHYLSLNREFIAAFISLTFTDSQNWLYSEERLNNSKQNLISSYKVSKILYSRKEAAVYRKT